MLLTDPKKMRCKKKMENKWALRKNWGEVKKIQYSKIGYFKRIPPKFYTYL